MENNNLFLDIFTNTCKCVWCLSNSSIVIRNIGSVIAMKSKFESCIKTLYYFYKLFGSYFILDGYLCSLELIYSLLVLVACVYCTWLEEYAIVFREHVFFHIQHVVLLVSVQVFFIAPLIVLLRFRLKNNDLRLLVTTANRLCSVNLSLSSTEYRRISWSAMLIHAYYVIYIFTLIADMEGNKKYKLEYIEKVCIVLIDIWITIPALQFVCWTLLFKFLFNKAARSLIEIMVRVKSVRGTFVEIEAVADRSRVKIKHLLKTMRLLVTFRMMITQMYDLQMIMFLWNICNSLVFQWNELLTLNLNETNGLIRPFLWIRLILLMVALFLIFWVSENSLRCVS